MSNTEVWNLITVFTVQELPNELKNRREKTANSVIRWSLRRQTHSQPHQIYQLLFAPTHTHTCMPHKKTYIACICTVWVCASPNKAENTHEPSLVRLGLPSGGSIAMISSPAGSLKWLFFSASINLLVDLLYIHETLDVTGFCAAMKPLCETTHPTAQPLQTGCDWCHGPLSKLRGGVLWWLKNPSDDC